MYVLQYIINGITLGSLYALIALGYSMVYGVLYFINFAHGDVAMIGAFLCFAVLMNKCHLPASYILGAIILSALVGVIIEKFSMALKNAPRLSMIISSLGISMSNGAQVIWGVATLPVPPVIPVKVYQFGVVMTNSLQLTILIMSTMLMVALQLLVNKTKLGLAMRATSFSMDTAHVMGIDTDKVVSQTFAIGSALAAAGIMMGIYYATIYPTMGATIEIKAFVSAVFGGIAIPGAMGAYCWGWWRTRQCVYFVRLSRHSRHSHYCTLIAKWITRERQGERWHEHH